MSLPPIQPDKTAAGIAVDPRTLERVVPETRRPDGSVRKVLKIRPGFTPQEDVSRFRGSKQQQQDRNALPKGHILGWVAPSSETTKKAAPKEGALSKSAKKNEKRREKKKEEKERIIKDSWEDSEEDTAVKAKGAPGDKGGSAKGEAGSSKSDATIDLITDKLKQTGVED